MTHGNRGKQLERGIRELFKRYEQIGMHCHQNHPRTLQDGTHAEKHGYDFECIYKGRFYAFDAKECKGASWSITTNAKVHQIKALRDVQANGGEGFFFVLFHRTRQLVKFPILSVIEYSERGMKSLRPQHGEILKGLDFLNVLSN